ncbi:hypothetical protein NW760_008761 [Fusarium oxysporum]|nr:hypothetical protein NW769_008879 [Fusarium oxysporum]KAJ4226691.1 hypothetical protein NW760_008761 [Fusarium oxysporum]
MAEIVRPALGQQVTIGTLYDARVDQFLQSSILPPNLPRGIVLRGILPPSDQLQNWMAEGSGHASRFRAMRVDDNLAASILSGSIDLEGSANFLKDSTVDENTLCGANWRGSSNVSPAGSSQYPCGHQCQMGTAEHSDNEAPHSRSESTSSPETVISERLNGAERYRQFHLLARLQQRSGKPVT